MHSGGLAERVVVPAGTCAIVPDGRGADVVIEASGAPGGPQRCVDMTRPGGRVVLLGLGEVHGKVLVDPRR